MNKNNTLFKELRRANGLTQQQVANYLYMERSTYAYIEIGRTKPTIDFLIALAHLYGLRLDTLLNEPPLENTPAGTPDLNFKHLSRLEQALVIQYRSGDSAQRKTMIDRALSLMACCNLA